MVVQTGVMMCEIEGTVYEIGTVLEIEGTVFDTVVVDTVGTVFDTVVVDTVGTVFDTVVVDTAVWDTVVVDTDTVVAVASKLEMPAVVDIAHDRMLDAANSRIGHRRAPAVGVCRWQTPPLLPPVPPPSPAIIKKRKYDIIQKRRHVVGILGSMRRKWVQALQRVETTLRLAEIHESDEIETGIDLFERLKEVEKCLTCRYTIFFLHLLFDFHGRLFDLLSFLVCLNIAEQSE
ncbi:hypothetical protein LXL04_012016 [Taraxacum kok-saghyz]